MAIAVDITASELLPGLSATSSQLYILSRGVLDLEGTTFVMDQAGLILDLGSGIVRNGVIDSVGDEVLISTGYGATLDGVNVLSPMLIDTTLSLKNSQVSNLTNQGYLTVIESVQVGAFEQGADAWLEMSLAPDEEGHLNVPRLSTLDPTTLEGTLRVVSGVDQTFAFMDRFDILDLTLTSDSGWFDQVYLPELDPGLTWDLQALASDGLLLVVTTKGDATGDSTVDQNDLNMLLANLGQSSESWQYANAEFTGDGMVDVRDLTVLLRNWSSSSAPVFDIPEPGSLLMLGVLTTLLGLRRR